MSKLCVMVLCILGILIPVLAEGQAVVPSVAPERGHSQQAGAVAGSTAAERDQPVLPGGGLTLIQLLQKGGVVMYPLYLCSILVLGFAVERLLTLRRRNVAPEGLLGELRSILDRPERTVDAGQVMALCEGQRNPLARIVSAGARRANRTILEVEKAMEDTSAREVVRLQRNNRVFSGVASVAPLLGLLGTATGIIRAFMTVAAMQDALGKSELLAGGIYEALVSTAAGLSIAIVALVLYLFFQERVEKLVSEMDDAATELSERLAVRT